MHACYTVPICLHLVAFAAQAKAAACSCSPCLAPGVLDTAFGLREPPAALARDWWEMPAWPQRAFPQAPAVHVGEALAFVGVPLASCQEASCLVETFLVASCLHHMINGSTNYDFKSRSTVGPLIICRDAKCV